MITQETWRPIPRYEHFYEVSNHGRIRRIAPGSGTHVGRIRKLTPWGGYLRVVLSRNNQQELHSVHRLVAMSFHGLPSGDRQEVNHLNGNRSDNRPENLEWVNRAGNCLHAYQTGLCVASPSLGESNGNAILTDEAVREIRQAYKTRRYGTIKLLTIKFGVSRYLIWQVATGKAWKHVHLDIAKAGAN